MQRIRDLFRNGKTGRKTGGFNMIYEQTVLISGKVKSMPDDGAFQLPTGEIRQFPDGLAAVWALVQK